MGTTKNSSRFYYPGLDVLRFGAFMLVFIAHTFSGHINAAFKEDPSPLLTRLVYYFVHMGSYGVDLFFVLSAYLITAILLREFETTGRVNIFYFYVRRALRIWPLYFVFLALSLFVFPHILKEEHIASVYKIPFSLFYGNWACATFDYPTSVILPLWSVSVEEQFYFAWPLLLLAFGYKRIPWLAGGLLVLSFARQAALVKAGALHTALWCDTLVRAQPIVAGAMLALINPKKLRLPRAARAWLTGLSLVGLYLLTAYEPDLRGPKTFVTFPLASVCCLGLVVAFLSLEEKNDSPLFKKIRHWGHISYGLYVFHLVGLNLIGMYFFLWIPALCLPIKFFGGLFFTIALAEISYRYLERPFLVWKEKFGAIKSGSEEEEEKESALDNVPKPALQTERFEGASGRFEEN